MIMFSFSKAIRNYFCKDTVVETVCFINIMLKTFMFFRKSFSKNMSTFKSFKTIQ